MTFLHTLVAFIVALALLIVVHEFGHYLVARWCKVRVLRFSVGFGRPVWTWRRGPDDTEWVVSAVPFGGYVKMLDEREAPVAAEELPRAFNRQSVWRRSAIVLAGPVFNFLFAIAVYAGLFVYGLPEARPVVAEPAAGTLARAAGFRTGDTVRAIDGEPIATWQELRWRVVQGALQREVLDVEVADAQGAPSVLTLDLRAYPAEDVEGDALDRVGLRLYRPTLEPVIGKIVAGGPAETAGIREGDRVLRAGDRPVERWDDVVTAVREHPARPLRLALQRGAETLAIDVVPEAVGSGAQRIGRIGAAALVPPGHLERAMVRVQHDPLTAVGKACAKTADIAWFSLKMLGRMLLGQVSWKNLSGPVTIADYAGQSAQMGWIAYVTFLALISVSLGVLNLLPVPLLDGGHLMYYAIEIFRGSPVSERAMEIGQRVGLALLLCMMAFAFYNDLNRLFSG